MHKMEHKNVSENRTQQRAEKYAWVKISSRSYCWALLTLLTCRATQCDRAEAPVQQQAHEAWETAFQTPQEGLGKQRLPGPFIGQGNSTGVLFLVLSAFASCLVCQSGFSQSVSDGTCIIFFDLCQYKLLGKDRKTF